MLVPLFLVLGLFINFGSGSEKNETELEDRFSFISFFHPLVYNCWSKAGSGRCVHLTQCPLLYSEVSRLDIGSIYQYLDDFTRPCNSRGEVCCPNYAVSADPTWGSPTERTTSQTTQTWRQIITKTTVPSRTRPNPGSNTQPTQKTSQGRITTERIASSKPIISGMASTTDSWYSRPRISTNTPVLKMTTSDSWYSKPKPATWQTPTKIRSTSTSKPMRKQTTSNPSQKKTKRPNYTKLTTTSEPMIVWRETTVNSKRPSWWKPSSTTIEPTVGLREMFENPILTTTPKPTKKPDNGKTDLAKPQDETMTRHKNRHLLPEDFCGVDLSNRIFGGNLTALDEFPWMALLRVRLPDGRMAFGCGGSLISTRYVLTAAHCFAGKSALKTGAIIDQVRLGEYNILKKDDCTLDGQCSPPPQDIDVAETIVHRGYSSNEPGSFHDIALLRLAKEAVLTKYIQPICLPLDSLAGKSYDEEKLSAAGWGRTANQKGSKSPIKLKVDLPVVPLRECARRYHYIDLRETQLCAGGEDGKDTCQGDSGGPLMSYDLRGWEFRWYVIGIVSKGPEKCGMLNSPAIYTRVSKYITWILDHLKP